MTIASLDQFQALAQRLREASNAYYNTGIPTMDDATFDVEMAQLRQAHAAHPEWEAADLLERVAGGQETGDVAHLTPMLSLDNVYDADEVRDFCRRVARKLGVSESSIVWSVEPKLDGSALSLVYESGKLQRVVTRGDGQFGEDVTTNARHVAGIWESLPEPFSGEVRGECIMTNADFEEANRIRLQQGDDAFANPRNAVTGTLRTKHRGYLVPMSFFAYGLGGAEGSHAQSMSYVASLGFAVAQGVVPGLSPTAQGTQAVQDAIELIQQARPNLLLEIDGAVIKADDAQVRQQMGEGSKSPRWATAYKYPAAARITRLLDIEVGVGRTGDISFTAVMEPVAVGGVTITNAMVHNPTVIAEMGLRLPTAPDSPGQRVEVYRAGDVIPQIRGAVDPGDVDGTAPYEPPALCPNGHELDRANKVWRCVEGRRCALPRNVQHFVSRDYGVDIEALGPKRVRALIDAGAVGDVADLFELDEAALLASIEHLGEKNAQKILNEISRARSAPVAKVVSGLGLTMTGRSMSRRLAAHFKDLRRLADADEVALQQVEGIGPDRAAAIRKDVEILRPVLDRLIAMGIGMPVEPAADATPSDGPLSGKTVVVTGTVPGLSRTQAQEAVERLGGRASGSVSKSTDLVVVGDGAGSKATKATSLGIAIMPAEEFVALVAAS